jgi:hypothetical protein
MVLPFSMMIALTLMPLFLARSRIERLNSTFMSAAVVQYPPMRCAQYYVFVAVLPESHAGFVFNTGEGNHLDWLEGRDRSFQEVPSKKYIKNPR